MQGEPQATGAADTAKAAVRLHEIADLLRSKQHLDPQEQLALAEIADELGKILERSKPTSAAPVALDQHISHIAEALHQGRASGPVQGVRDRMTEIAASMETRAPYAAALAHQLVDVLAGLGI